MVWGAILDYSTTSAFSVGDSLHRVCGRRPMYGNLRKTGLHSGIELFPYCSESGAGCSGLYSSHDIRYGNRNITAKKRRLCQSTEHCRHCHALSGPTSYRGLPANQSICKLEGDSEFSSGQSLPAWNIQQLR